MNILVTHVFSIDNKGDAALLSVLISDLKRVFPNANIAILSMDNIKEDEVFDECRVYNSFSHHIFYQFRNKGAKLIYASFVIGATIIWSVVSRYAKYDIWLPTYLRRIVRMYRDADLIVPVGGGYIRGKNGVMSTASLGVTLHSLVIGNILDKPTVIYPQSVGPFAGKIQLNMAKSVLKKVKLIVVREDISLSLLKEMGISRNVIRSIDSGFVFKSHVKKDLRRELGIPDQRIVVGVTVRKWLPKDRQKRFEKELAKFIDGIIRNNSAFVVFIPQVTSEFHEDDDRVASQDVWKHIKNKDNAVVLMDRFDHKTIKAMYDSLDLMVGNHFHSVIFSLTSFVPSIAIEYEHKTSGIMRDLALDKWVVKMEDVTSEKLEKLFIELLSSREFYSERLKSVLPVFILEARKLCNRVKELYEGRDFIK